MTLVNRCRSDLCVFLIVKGANPLFTPCLMLTPPRIRLTLRVRCALRRLGVFPKKNKLQRIASAACAQALLLQWLLLPQNKAHFHKRLSKSAYRGGFSHKALLLLKRRLNHVEAMLAMLFN